MRHESKQIQAPLNPEMSVRRYRIGEEETLQEIYIRSTQELVARDYTPDQIDRWVNKHSNLSEWTARLRKTDPFVVVIEDSPVAFGELESDGHIDFFYCHPDWQGHGAGSHLLNFITREALKLGLTALFAEVSVTAEPFFSKKGFRIMEERNPIICDSPARQYIMRKEIG